MLQTASSVAELGVTDSSAHRFCLPGQHAHINLRT